MWEINPVPALDAGLVHVFFELGDHLWRVVQSELPRAYSESTGTN